MILGDIAIFYNVMNRAFYKDVSKTGANCISEIAF